MISVVQSHSGSLGGSTRFLGIQGYYANNGTSFETNVSQQMTEPGTLRNLVMNVSTAPGAAASGKKWNFTVTKNGIATAISFDILETATTNSDTTHIVSYVAGDRMGITCTPTNTPTSPTTYYSMEMNQQGQTLMWSDPTISPSTSATQYMTLQMGTFMASAPVTGCPIPTAGTFRNLQMRLNGSAGTGKGWTATLFINGVATALTKRIADLNTNASDTTHSVSVSAGDLAYWQLVPDNTPSSGRFILVSATFVPTIDGESIQTYYNPAAWIPAGAVQYIGQGGGSASSATTENLRSNPIYSLATLKNLYVATDAAPASGKSFTFVLRDAGANTTVTTTISDTATTNHDTTHSATIAASNDISGLGASGTGTPVTAAGGAGWVTYLAPGTDSGFIGFF